MTDDKPDVYARTTDTPEVLAALRGAGWAPGRYIVACMDCGPGDDGHTRDWRMGDKRCLRCRPCAEKVVAARKDDAADLIAYIDSLDGQPGFLERVGVLLAGAVVANETAPREPQPGLTRMDEPQVDANWLAAAPESWDADYASVWARLQQASERASKWHACFKDAKAERDAALSRAEAAEAERDALRVVARAAHGFRKAGMFDAVIAYEELADALDALPPGSLQSG